MKSSLFGIAVVAVMVLFGACSGKPGQSGEDAIKLKQYYLQGEQLFAKNCSNCHQKNGKGLGLVYPPLDQSDFIDNNLNQVICLIRYGKKGELLVNGKSFNQEMKGLPLLTDLEIAEITTYLYNTWGRERGLIDVKETTRLLNACEVP